MPQLRAANLMRRYREDLAVGVIPDEIARASNDGGFYRALQLSSPGLGAGIGMVIANYVFGRDAGLVAGLAATPLMIWSLLRLQRELVGPITAPNLQVYIFADQNLILENRVYRSLTPAEIAQNDRAIRRYLQEARDAVF